MSMKSLLLGAAAGLAAIGAAQAADLPMSKGEAVEYVKVCSTFGPGFFYIPGSDTCLKLSGEIRADYRGFGGSASGHYLRDRGGEVGVVAGHWKGKFGRNSDRSAFDTQARLMFDARTQTDYGLLRSYIQLNINGYTSKGGSADFEVDKAFLQFGGLTAGYAHSIFGLYDNLYGDTIWASYYSDFQTVNMISYTADFGGGFSATLALEDSKKHRLGGLGVPGYEFRTNEGPALLSANDFGLLYGGTQSPDIVGNVVLDQSWGTLQASGALHQFRDGDVGGDTKWGYAVGGTAVLKFDQYMDGGHFVVEGQYADGALDYLGASGTILGGTDFYVNRTSTKGGKGWSVVAELGGNITPVWNFNLVGSYIDTKYDNAVGYGIDTSVKEYTLAGNLTYTVVKGLTVAGEVGYTHSKFSDLPVYIDGDDSLIGGKENSYFAGVRIKRVF